MELFSQRCFSLTWMSALSMSPVHSASSLPILCVDGAPLKTGVAEKTTVRIAFFQEGGLIPPRTVLMKLWLSPLLTTWQLTIFKRLGWN